MRLGVRNLHNRLHNLLDVLQHWFLRRLFQIHNPCHRWQGSQLQHCDQFYLMEIQIKKKQFSKTISTHKNGKLTSYILVENSYPPHEWLQVRPIVLEDKV